MAPAQTGSDSSSTPRAHSIRLLPVHHHSIEQSNPFGSASKKSRKLLDDDVEVGPTVIVTKVKTKGDVPIDGFVVTPMVNFADMAMVCPMFNPQDAIKKRFIETLNCIYNYLRGPNYFL